MGYIRTFPLLYAPSLAQSSFSTASLLEAIVYQFNA